MLRNMTPAINLPCTPFEKWTGAKPDLSKLRVLGCKAICQIAKSARGGKCMPKVYNVAAPAFDEDADPGWWRSPEADVEEDEPLLFPAFPPPLADPSSPVSEVIDSSPEEDIPDALSAILGYNAE